MANVDLSPSYNKQTAIYGRRQRANAAQKSREEKKLGIVQVGNVPFSPEIFITDVAVSDAASILSLSLTVVDLDTVARSRCNRDRRRVRVF